MKQRQHHAPLFEKLVEYIKHVKGNFHVPGHKQGRAFDEVSRNHFDSLLQLDLTEVANLDDLHDPKGVIAEAEDLAAEAFGAEQTFFLVGGSTAGNLVSLLYLCAPGDEAIIQRSSHQSVFHGCLLAGVKPIYIGSDLDTHTGWEQTIDPIQIEQLLQTHPQVKGVWITSPSYFGVNQPLKKIATVCHRYQVPLIVDEAHGAHYVFHDQLPKTAIEAGADIVIQSTHKMLSSMTMSSMLHLQGERVSSREIRQWLRVIESSSPSYPLMASLDVTRRWMMTDGKHKLHEIMIQLQDLREQLQSLHHLRELSLQSDQDPFKMSLTMPHRSGFSLSSELEQQGVFVEMATPYSLLLVFSLGTTTSELQLLWKRGKRLDQQHSDRCKSFSQEQLPTTNWTRGWAGARHTEISFAQMRSAKKSRIPLTQAEGRIVTEMIIPYPPGIPLILPGERLDISMIDELTQFIDEGGKVRGIDLTTEKHVLVMNEKDGER